MNTKMPLLNCYYDRNKIFNAISWLVSPIFFNIISFCEPTFSSKDYRMKMKNGMLNQLKGGDEQVKNAIENTGC